MIKKTNVEKIYECVDGLTKEINDREKKINKLESRIVFLQSEEYGHTIKKSAIQHTVQCILFALKEQVNYDVLKNKIIKVEGDLTSKLDA